MAVVRRLLIGTAAGMALLAACPLVRAQDPTAPSDVVLPPPRSAVPPPTSSPAVTIGPPAAVQPPSPFLPPGSGAADPVYQPRDPGPNGWGPYGPPSAPPSFFADVEVDILKPHLKAALSNSAFFPDGSQTTVRPPSVPVGWTAAPRIEFGWQAPNSLGFLAVWYRGFATDGQQNATSLADIPFVLRTRLDLNEGALDYGIAPYSFAPHWDVSGRIGIAAADVFFDNRAGSAPQTLYASNNYLGAGPHLRMDIRRHVGLLPGLDLFGRLDLIVLEGQIHQRFMEQDLNADGSTSTGTFVQRKTQTVPVFTVQAGLSYSPPSLPNWSFAMGYQFEEWWYIGQMDLLDSRGQLSTNGVFLGAYVNF